MTDWIYLIIFQSPCQCLSLACNAVTFILYAKKILYISWTGQYRSFDCSVEVLIASESEWTLHSCVMNYRIELCYSIIKFKFHSIQPDSLLTNEHAFRLSWLNARSTGEPVI